MRLREVIAWIVVAVVLVFALATIVQGQGVFNPARITVVSDGTVGGTIIEPGSTTGSLRYVEHRTRVYTEGGNTVIAVELVVARRRMVFLPVVGR